MIRMTLPFFSLVAISTASLVTPSPVAGDAEETAPLGANPSPDVREILRDYALYLDRATERISTLIVDQEMIEPQRDGEGKRSTAVLRYSRDEGMTRLEIASDIRYPAGNFTLQSLIGPKIPLAEYEAVLEGTEVLDGIATYRLHLTALERDVDHFDGRIWVSCEDSAPVRIVGRVSDPPFPVSEITLDKAFQRAPNGIWLLRRHSGEAEVGVLVARKRGLRHIFYDGYVLNEPLPPEGCLPGEGDTSGGIP
jgi:hypothetical protein